MKVQVLQRAKKTHNSSIRSDEGPTLETSAHVFQTLHGSKILIVTTSVVSFAADFWMPRNVLGGTLRDIQKSAAKETTTVDKPNPCLSIGSLRVNACKNRPKSPISGTSRKIDFAFILPTDRS